MSRDPQALSHHPSPQAEEVSAAMTALMLFTGPLAWFAQFCIGFALASQPCFSGPDRQAMPIQGYGWTGTAALILLIVCALLASGSALVSWRALQRVKGEEGGDHADLIEVGHGRTRFTALWGTILGAGFAVATLATLTGFAMVPRCAG